MKKLSILILLSWCFQNCEVKTPNTVNSISTNNLDEKWSEYYEKIKATALLANSYIEIIESNAPLLTERISDNVYKINPEILDKEDKKKLLSILQSYDTTVFVSIKIPFKVDNTTLHKFVYSDKNFFSSFDFSDDNFTYEWKKLSKEDDLKNNYRLASKELLIWKNNNNSLHQSTWANLLFENQDTIKGMRFSYLEHIDVQAGEVIEVIVYIPRI